MKRSKRARRCLSLVLVFFLLPGTVPVGLAYSTDQPAAPVDVQPAEPTPTQLQQLVAPIALYPDELVAQILAAATYPEQVVEAERWMEQHGRDNEQQLAQEVDAQAWDPSVKALTQFPSVLANMDKNLSWTSSLGDAYVNHQPDVMDAIQAMRRRAQQAGTLQTTSQQKVVEQGSQIVIQPAAPEMVYVPQYDPWVAYGAPVVAWPGWYWYPGLYVPGPGILFGVGFGVGLFTGFGWGWGHWGCDWGHRTVVFNHNTFVSSGRTFINRRAFEGGRAGVGRLGNFHGPSGFGGARGFGAPGGFNRGGAPRGSGAFHAGDGFGGAQQHVFVPHTAPQGRWGAFSGFDHGGATGNLSARGSSSFGGFHGGGFGGGSHGGGGGHR